MLKKIIFLFVLIIKICTLFSQGTDSLPPNSSTTPEPIYGYVQEMPEFPGGESALKEYVKNYPYSKKAIQQKLWGTVWITIVIEKDGHISSIKVLKSDDKSLTTVAIELVQKMPKWKSGKKDGIPVRVQYSLPIYIDIKKFNKEKNHNSK